MGRPSAYTPEMVEEICERLASGQSLATICKNDEIPSITTVMNWLAKSEQGDENYSGFVERYVRAREAQADVIFDECLDIADESGAEITIDKETGRLKIEGEVIQRAKLRIETRMRMAGKLRPKKYGDNKHVEVNNTGTVTHVSIDLQRLAGHIREINGCGIDGILSADDTGRPLLPDPVRTE